MAGWPISAAANVSLQLLWVLQISAAIAAVLQQKLNVDPSRFYIKVRLATAAKWSSHN